MTRLTPPLPQRYSPLLTTQSPSISFFSHQRIPLSLPKLLVKPIAGMLLASLSSPSFPSRLFSPPAPPRPPSSSSLLLRRDPLSSVVHISKNADNNAVSFGVGRSEIKKPSSSYSLLVCRAQMYDSLAPAASVVYGTLLLGGGVYAYLRSGSKGSILGGASGAVLMATTYFLMQTPGTRDIGDAFGFGSALIFSAIFGIRLAATRKPFPSGFLLALSLCSLAIFLSSYMHDKLIIQATSVM